LYEETVAEMERKGQPVDGFSREAFTEAMLISSKYGVIPFAAGAAVVAGGFGMPASVIAGGRRPRRLDGAASPPPPGPTSADPPA
jgi:hypothetical protein